MAMMEKRRILILGKGFIGTQLHRHLKALGHEVRAIASAQCDLRDPECVEETLGRLTHRDTLILAAAKTRVGGEPRAVYHDNVAIARSVAQFLHAHELHQLIFLSTTDVYGTPAPGCSLDEGSALNPIGAYAQSKAVSETLLQHVCSPYRNPLMVLRFPGVYGPGDRGESVVGRMLREARRRGQITVYGEGSERRDYLHVRDLAQVTAQVIDDPRHSVVNVATGESRAIRDIADTVAARVERPVEVCHVPNERQRCGFDLNFDVSRLRKMFPQLDWTNLETGIT